MRDELIDRMTSLAQRQAHNCSAVESTDVGLGSRLKRVGNKVQSHSVLFRDAYNFDKGSLDFELRLQLTRHCLM